MNYLSQLLFLVYISKQNFFTPFVFLMMLVQSLEFSDAFWGITLMELALLYSFFKLLQGLKSFTTTSIKAWKMAIHERHHHFESESNKASVHRSSAIASGILLCPYLKLVLSLPQIKVVNIETPKIWPTFLWY